MTQRPWLKYVHWFGYVASVLVVLQLLFLGYLGLQYLKRQEEYRDSTRMHREPIERRLVRQLYWGHEITLLRQLPPISALGSDGFRAIISPSLWYDEFAIALHRTAAGGEGVMIIASRDPQHPSSERVTLKILLQQYVDLTTRLDALALAWQGETGAWTDGLGVVFERVSRDGVTSGLGNSPNFHGKIAALIFDAVRPASPQLALFDRSWRRKAR